MKNLYLIKTTDTFQNFPDHKSLDNVLDNVYNLYYRDWPQRIIIDRGPVLTSNNPGNFEIEMGQSFGEFIDTFGKGIKNNKNVKAYIPGGASAPWFTGDQLDIKMTIDDVANAGSMLGSGAVVVMDEDTNLVYAAKSIVSFFAHESCGQCTPCREGTGWLYRLIHRIRTGVGSASDLDKLINVADKIEGRTICALGDAAAWPVQSFLKHFRGEFESKISSQVAA